MIKTAVIMAAGLGTRFGKMTESMPKGFVEVCGRSMVIRSIETLIDCGIERILIGTGYKNNMYEALNNIYPQIETCFSPRYAETNSMYTLWNMRELIGNDDFILLESDLVFEPKAISSLIENVNKDVMLVSPVIKFQDQYYVEANNDGYLTKCSVNKEELNYIGELVGIHKLSNSFYKAMCESYSLILDEKPKLGYEYQLITMSNTGYPVYVLKVDGLKWYEIDDERDLEYAEKFIITK